jgi:hypothetical protein
MMILHFLLLLRSIITFHPESGEVSPFPEMQATFQSIRVSLEPDFENGGLRGRAEYRMMPRAGNAERLVFLVHDLVMDSVRLSSGGASVQIEGDTLRIIPARPLTAPFNVLFVYHTGRVSGVHRTADSLWVSSLEKSAQAGWMPIVDHPSIYTAATIEAVVPAGLTFIANGQRGKAEPLETGFVRQRYETAEPVRMQDLNWQLGRFREVMLADSTRFITLFAEKTATQTDSLLGIARHFAKAFSAMEQWRGEDLPYTTFSGVILPDLFWESRTEVPGLARLSTLEADAETMARLSVVRQVLGGVVFPADSVASRWFSSAHPALYTTLFGKEPVLKHIPLLHYRARGFAGFSVSEAVLKRWARYPAEAEAQDLLQWAWEADGRSHFGLQAADKIAARGPVITVRWIDSKPKPKVELTLDSLATLNVRVGAVLRRDTIWTAVNLTAEEVVEVEMRQDARNLVVRDVPEGGLVLFEKPEAFWIHQVRTSGNFPEKMEGLRALRGVRNNPDLQLFLFDLMKTEKNPAVRSEVLSTLAAYLNGATGSLQLIMDELNNPDSSVKREAIRSLRFYGVNADIFSRLNAELRRNHTPSNRKELVISLSAASDSTAWLRFVERLVLRQEHPDVLEIALQETARRYRNFGSSPLLERWITGRTTPRVKAVLMAYVSKTAPFIENLQKMAQREPDIRVGYHFKKICRERVLQDCEGFDGGVWKRDVRLK